MNEVSTDILTYSDCDDYTYCPLIEGSRQMFRLSSWELGLEIARQVGEDWLPKYDDSYMIVLRGNSKFTSLRFARDDGGEYSVSNDVLRHFEATVPKEIQKIVGDHFQYSQIQLLKAIRYCPELMELARCCLPLFWLVVEKNSHVNVLGSWAFARLLTLKRKEILDRLGYVGTQSSVRLLSKIQIDRFTDEDLFSLKDVMSSAEKISLLRHFKEIGEAHLFVASHYPKLLKYTFIRNELERKDIVVETIKRIALLCEDICNMAEMLPNGNIEAFFRTIKYSAQLDRCHDALVSEMHVAERNSSFLKNMLDTYSKEKFPPPPVNGTPSIQPIFSLSELAREGEEMQNCVLTYAHHIYESRFFCYKILEPERGTIGLDLTKGKPTIAEIKLKKNITPSELTVCAVKEWLEVMSSDQERLGL